MSKLRVTDPTFGDSVETAFRRFLAPIGLESDIAALKMRIDVSEKDDAYEIKADLPGVKKEDINIRIDGNVVQIDAEVKRDQETRGQNNKVLRSERFRGNISRSFSLAQDVDEAGAKARYSDGVLHLELPKKSGESVKKVPVQ